MDRSNRTRLGWCLPAIALLGLVGCESPYRGDRGYGGYYGNRPYAAYPSGRYYGGPYDDRYGGYRRGWVERDRDDRERRTGNGWQRQKRYAGDEWKERRYERLNDNGRRGDAERFNNRLCRNGIPGDAPAGC